MDGPVRLTGHVTNEEAIRINALIEDDRWGNMPSTKHHMQTRLSKTPEQGLRRVTSTLSGRYLRLVWLRISLIIERMLQADLLVA